MLGGCGNVSVTGVGHAQTTAATSERVAPAKTFLTSEWGTAFVQDLRDGIVFFDFTNDNGATETGLRVRAAEIDGLGHTVLEPRARLRLKLSREFVQVGAEKPREVGRAWELLRPQ